MRQLLIPLLLFAVSSLGRPQFVDDESLFENLNKTLLEIYLTPVEDLTLEELSAALGKHIPPEHREAAKELLQYKDDRPYTALLGELQTYGSYDKPMAEEFSRGVMRALLDKSYALSPQKKLQPGDHICRCNMRECASFSNELYYLIGHQMSNFCRVDKFGYCMRTQTRINDTTKDVLYCGYSHATSEQKQYHEIANQDHFHICKSTTQIGRTCCKGAMCNDMHIPSTDLLELAYEEKLRELAESLAIWKGVGVSLMMAVLIILAILLITIVVFCKFGNWDEARRRLAVASENRVRLEESNKFTKRLLLNNEVDLGSSTGSESPLIPPSLASSDAGTTTGGSTNCKTTKTFYDMETTIGVGTGMGGTLVAQRTLSSFIRITSTLGQGKFGKVFLGEWRGGEKIAVKKFDHVLYDSFEQEVEILMSGMMSNSNILRWIGKDTVDTGSATEFWIISEYHPNGSLYDYMEINPLSEENLLLMMRGIANGISFLHSEIPENEGTTGKKGVAHRDLKTKNILVKSDLTCVIADFGMAVINNREGVRLPPGTKKSGTVRYLSPEVLVDNIAPVSEFEYYRSSDMYSFGLIMWECARRSFALFGNTELAAHSMEESLAYYADVPREPSVADMKEAVVYKELRPHVPDIWRRNPVFMELSRMMRECWTTNSSARLTALNVKIAIDRLASQLNLTFPSGYD